MKAYILPLLVGFSLVTVLGINAQEYSIPPWIKNNALWWSDGDIDDASFLSGIKYLIDHEIMIIPAQKTSTEASLPFVPNWIKDTAGWWATGKVTDADFVNGMTWLVENGIIQVSGGTLCSGSVLCITDTVTRIIDGDTIYIKEYKIRLSLTNTPEYGEPGFSEAALFTRMMCPVGSVILVDQDDFQLYDVYGRMLAKVFCDGKNLNEELILAGHGWILAEYCHSSEFSGEAWAKNGCSAKASPSRTSNCDPSYPDFCIPPPPPDLDCSDIPQKGFTVLQPDPHRFDGDKDGIGCES